MKTLTIILTLSTSVCFSQKLIPTKDTIKGLEELEEILEQGKVLRAVLGVASFYMLFADEPDPAKLYDIATTDWEQMGKMLQKAGSLDKIAARKLCDHYIMVHEGHFMNLDGVRRRNHLNSKFWQNMRTKFQ